MRTLLYYFYFLSRQNFSLFFPDPLDQKGRKDRYLTSRNVTRSGIILMLPSDKDFPTNVRSTVLVLQYSTLSCFGVLDKAYAYPTGLLSYARNKFSLKKM